MFEDCPQKIETPRLIIRLAKESDLIDLLDLHSRDDVNQYLPYTTWTSWHDAVEWFGRVQQRRSEQQAQQYSIDIKNRTTTEFVGSCIVFNFDQKERSAEFGYVLHPNHWGKGLMLEAMTMFTQELQRKIGLRSLKASVESPNLSSLKLLSTLGFAHDFTTHDEVALQHWVKKY